MARASCDPGLPVSNPTESYWQQPPHQQLFKSQSSVLPTRQDVVIIGSGITGCSVAWHLLQEGSPRKVTVLDAREICSGATGRNGGRINCTAVQDFDRYSSLFGAESAKRIVEFELAHLDAIFSLVNSLGPECLRKSQLRHVDAITALFDYKAVQSMRAKLTRFEAAIPELRGRWKVIDEEEVSQVSDHPHHQPRARI
jgi:glycine/D-amino acid oxidase-like deaminating enzyme